MIKLAAWLNPARYILRWFSYQDQYPAVPIPQVFWVALRSVAVTSTAVTGVCLAVQALGGLEPLELAVFDQWTRLRPEQPADPRLLIVQITESDIRRYGWPIPDLVLAQALSKLQMYQPSVIGLDLYRDISTPPGAAELNQQLQADNLIAIANNVGEVPPPPIVSEERVGFNDFTLDPDGVLRRNLLFVAGAEQDHYSFALRLSLERLVQQGITFRYTPEALYLGNTALPRLLKADGGYQTADTRGYQILLDYRSHRQGAPAVSLGQLLDTQDDLSWLEGRIVLVGTVAPSLKDFLVTPYSAVQHDSFQMSGVVVHAHMVSHLLDLAAGNRQPFKFWPQWAEILWLAGWTITGSLLVWGLRRPLALGATSVLCLLLIGTVGWLMFTQAVWIPVGAPALGFVGALCLAMAHRLFYSTSRDPLTGLLNQPTLLSLLERSLSLQTGRPVLQPTGLLFLSLNRFQLVKVSLGQIAGDYVLLQLVNRLRACLPRSARLARIGADEFAISLQSFSKASLERLADQIQASLAEPLKINHQLVVVEANIGIAVTQPNHVHTSENLLRDAHTAMYRAKALGKARYEVFAAGMLEADIQRFTLEGDLRRGVIEQQFLLYYQPIVSLATEKIVGFESLVRWQHPQEGFVSPAKFIPLAEETGLIIALGQWICEEACRQARLWKEQFPTLPLMLSINLSSRQFEQPNLVEQLAGVLQESGLQQLTFKLEITESMVMGDVEAAIDLMLRLRSLGCRLSLDDFGTGYSSLSYLRRLPIDTLKIDQSFVKSMDNSSEDFAIVRTIIDLAHTLGMDVIAEGVETAANFQALRSLSCDFGQGFFWAKPMSAHAAGLLLEQQLER